MVAATSLTIKWCERLADAFIINGERGLVEIRRKDHSFETAVSIQAMELTVQGLRANTEYELLFDVYINMSANADTTKVRILTRHIRTKYYCKCITL